MELFEPPMVRGNQPDFFHAFVGVRMPVVPEEEVLMIPLEDLYNLADPGCETVVVSVSEAVESLEAAEKGWAAVYWWFALRDGCCGRYFCFSRYSCRLEVVH
jgi:hypothetical protein